MDSTRLELLYQYALTVAAQEDFPCQELGPIHLLKYAYLADLAYAEKHCGETFTHTPWRFHHFGPWAVEAYQRIAPAMEAIGATGRHFSSQYQEDHVRWRFPQDRAPRSFEKSLPWAVEREIRRSVHEYGADTVSLLHHVYATFPMLRAAPGDILDFNPGEPPREGETKAAEPESSQQEVAALPKLSKTKLKKLKALLRERLDQRQHRSRLVPPDPPPRYDEVFAQGQEWLESLAGAPVEETSGTLEFSDDIWPVRVDIEKELP
jgi:hypothetical protein